MTADRTHADVRRLRPAERIALYERYVTGGVRTYADLVWLNIGFFMVSL